MLIKIKNLRLYTYIGIYQHEKLIKQELCLNLIITTNNTNACISDNIADTIDYGKIYNIIKDFSQNHKCELLEKFAYDLLKLIMSDKKIVKCHLEVEKINIFPDVDSCIVALEMTQE